MTPFDSARLRRRLFWTAVLMLVALGGAGLASAADRPATDDLRPELYARADLRAAPWLAGMLAQLHAVDDGVSDLAHAARDVLASLQRLDPGQLTALLAGGDTAASDLEVAVMQLGGMRDDPPAGLDQARLSMLNRELLGGVDRALAATLPLDTTWRELSGTARDLATLVDSVFRHESLVFAATSAAREVRWTAALDLLDEGRTALALASGVRDRLAEPNRDGTIDDLLDRYAAYSDALTELYTELRDGAALDSPSVTNLLAAVDTAQQALPDDTDALRVAVSELGGATLAEAVLALERARGVMAQVVGALP